MPRLTATGDRSNAALGAALYAWQLAFTAFSIFLSLQDHVVVWFVGQLLLGINMLQWFVVQHDIGHRALFRSKWASAILGHLSSLFCLLPYYPWRDVHHVHHRWTGWRKQDPTIPVRAYEDYRPLEIAIINFCWKHWIPMFAFTFNVTTFMNLRRLRVFFPDRADRLRHLFSIVFMLGTVAVVAVVFRDVFLRTWLLAFFVFLSLSDPYLLSQHTHIDYLDDGTEPRRVPFAEQHTYSRTTVFPWFIETLILYNSNRHGLHHQFPTVPCFRLSAQPTQAGNGILWTDWLRRAKALPAHDLIFHSTRHTGVDLMGALRHDVDG